MVARKLADTLVQSVNHHLRKEVQHFAVMNLQTRFDGD